MKPANHDESYQEVDPESQKFTAVVRENCGALLSRQWHYVLPLALAAYFGLQSAVTYFSVCNGKEPIKPWTQAVIVSIAGCFMLSVAYHAVIGFIMGVYSADSKELAYPRSVYTAAAVISLVAGISACVKVNDNYQSICTDALGMQTFSSQWPEWLVDVPLLGYITVALEDKYELEREDKVLICMMFSMIFFGFLANMTADPVTGCILLSISASCIVGNFYVAFKSSKDIQIKAADAASKGRNGRSTAALNAQWAFDRMMMKGRLSWLLIYVLPLFPLTYGLGLSGIFDRDQVIASNMICSVFAKLIFVGALSLESVFIQLSLRGTDNRKKALKNATLEGYSLKPRGTNGGIGGNGIMNGVGVGVGGFGTNLNPKYDSLNQVSSVEDEVNFNLVKIQNESSLGYKTGGTKRGSGGGRGGYINPKGCLKSKSDGPLIPSTSTPPPTKKYKGVSTGNLSTNF